MTAPLSSLADHADERFTEAQLAKLAEFDAAPVPPEIRVERIRAENAAYRANPEHMASMREYGEYLAALDAP